MITGVETAGLVLAAFPLILELLKVYQEGFETLVDWWRFRTEFLTFIHGLGVQSVLFSENLELLLSPIVVSDAEMYALLNEPGGETWRNPDIEERLKARLPNSYALYQFTIDHINEIMEKLKKKLGNKIDSIDSKNKHMIRWEYELARLKWTLGKKTREKLLEKLEKLNGDLRMMLGSTEALAVHRQRRKSVSVLAFHRIREKAYGLHDLLKSVWRCPCRPSHNAGLLLENHISASSKGSAQFGDMSETQFYVLLYARSKPVQIQPPPWIWHETKVQISEAESPQAATQPSGSPSGRASNKPQSSSNSNLLQVQIPEIRKTVEFALDADQSSQSSTTHSEQGFAEIQDLCSEIAQAQHEQEYLGFLIDAHKRRYGFFPNHKRNPNLCRTKIVTLEALLRNNNVAEIDSPISQADSLLKLSRRDRLYVAAMLSISLLELHSTPWLTETWTKKDIFFLCSQEDSTATLDTDRFYISSADASQESNALSDTAVNRDGTARLFALGVMLLELCFGKALEDHPMRNSYFGMDGKPNDWTDFATARHWLNAAIGEAGPQYAEVVRKCIYCAFAQHSTDLSTREFIDAVYAEVVEPLWVVLRQFDPDVKIN